MLTQEMQIITRAPVLLDSLRCFVLRVLPCNQAAVNQNHHLPQRIHRGISILRN
jgi:hypothetical protein